MRILVILLSCVYLMSCNIQRAREVTYQSFEDSTVGWKTQYPSSFRLMEQAEIDQIQQRGKVALENQFDSLEITHRNLLWVKRNPFNSFTSNVQPYDSITDGPYIDSRNAVNQAILQAFDDEGIPYEVNFGTETIDGLDFRTMNTILLAADKKEVILSQTIYDRLIDGKYVLTLNVNYNTERDRQALLTIINNSTFSKRD